jgi:hypothetical protein
MLTLLIGVLIVLGVVGTLKVRRARYARALRQEELSRRAELEAYAALDPAARHDETPRALASRVCTAIARHSAFRQVAMLMRDADGRLNVAASAGVDHLSALEINAWVARFARERHRWLRQGQCRSIPVTLSSVKAVGPTPPAELAASRNVIVLPVWARNGEVLGALAVWPDAKDAAALARPAPLAPELLPSHQSLAPLERLAERLGHPMEHARNTANQIVPSQGGTHLLRA